MTETFNCFFLPNAIKLRKSPKTFKANVMDGEAPALVISASQYCRLRKLRIKHFSHNQAFCPQRPTQSPQMEPS